MKHQMTKMIRFFALVCGILSVLFYVLHDILGSKNYPGYNWMRQAVSDLTAIDSPSITAIRYISLYKLFSCLCCVFLWVLASHQPKSIRIGIYLFAIMNWVSAIGYTLFPLSGAGYDNSFQSFVHTYIVTVAVVILSIVSMALIAIRSLRNKDNLLGILAIIALICMFIGAVGSQNVPTDYFGLVERISTYAAVVFTGVLSLLVGLKLVKQV